jgi:hypothetical protein
MHSGREDTLFRLFMRQAVSIRSMHANCSGRREGRTGGKVGHFIARQTDKVG